MDICCLICGRVIPADEQKYAEVYKLKNVTEDFIRKHSGRVYDGFIFQHYGCWITIGRFGNYALDINYFFYELEQRMFFQTPDKNKK